MWTLLPTTHVPAADKLVQEAQRAAEEAAAEAAAAAVAAQQAEESEEELDWDQVDVKMPAVLAAEKAAADKVQLPHERLYAQSCWLHCSICLTLLMAAPPPELELRVQLGCVQLVQHIQGAACCAAAAQPLLRLQHWARLVTALHISSS